MGYHPKIEQTLQQNQKLVMSQAMKRAFLVLELPLLELSTYLESALSEIPIYEIRSRGGQLPFDLTSGKPSLNTYLAKTIPEHFEGQEREIARVIGGSLDSKGFLSETTKALGEFLGLGEEAITLVLKKFQRMEPVGLGTSDAREALLLQLDAKGLSNSISARILHEQYDNLLHGRLSAMGKSLRLSVSKLREVIRKEIRPLNPFPGTLFEGNHNPSVVPDLSIEKVGGVWRVEVEEGFLPEIELNPNYQQFEGTTYVRRHLAAGNWLFRTLEKRRKLLQQIGEYIVVYQHAFLEGIVPSPAPMTMRAAAKELEMSESTMTRALKEKYVSTDRGVIPLRSFFNRGVDAGEKAKALLFKLVRGEERSNPLSDQSLANLIGKEGITCARRTVAKYRGLLKIPPAAQRRS